MSIKTQYKEFKILKRDVITRATKEVNETSNIKIEPKFQTSGKTVHAVQFKVAQNAGQQLSLPETPKNSLTPGLCKKACAL